MNITPTKVNQNYANINFASKKTSETKLVQKPDKFQRKTKKPQKFTHKLKDFFVRHKNAFVAAISSAVSALSVFLFMKNKNDGLKINNNELEKENDTLKKQNNSLKTLNDDLQAKLDNVILPKDYNERIKETAEKIYSQDLNYNPLQPPIAQDDKYHINKKTVNIVMPEKHEKTHNRRDAIKLNYPKYNPCEPYGFIFPMSKDMVITRVEPKDFQEERQITNISENYSSSLAWDDDKIARDLLQNFFDGHHQTLDGVSIEIIPTKDNKQKVKISGQSTYDYDKAIMLGESSKKDNANSAGNYGEGLKMVVLKLLKEKGARNVDIASNNWKVSWSLADGNLNKNRVLAYELSKSKQLDGNYIEFETDDRKLTQAIINSYDRFYHYNNPAFKEPDFENDILGVKFLDNKNEKGKLYIAGQAFEVLDDGFSGVTSSYDGLKGVNLFIKQKPPTRQGNKIIFDASRDRVALSDKNFEAIGEWIARNENLSDEDFVELLQTLHRYWSNSLNEDGNVKRFFSGLLDYFSPRASRLNIKFPNEKEVASEFSCINLEPFYERAGYIMCSPALARYGMTPLSQIVKESRQHSIVSPDDKEIKKIKILKHAISLMSNVLLKDNFFTKEELDCKIYIFDNTSGSENKAYDIVQGEAILEGDTSNGFWLDKNTIDNKSFSELLSISLHEMTHKYGPDCSDVFSYKLTDVIEMITKAMTENPNLAIQLKALEQMWNEV